MISYIDNTKNVVTEIPITIAASSWSSSAPYTYTLEDSRILSGSSVEVDILSTSTDTSAISVDYTKEAGSITFTASAKPTGDIALNICIINARADLGTSISADTVATDAIPGASNVDQALETLNGKIDTTDITSSTSLLTLAENTPSGTTRKYWTNSASNITDYPSSMTSIGATSYVQITIERRIGIAAIRITAVKANGASASIFGEKINESFYWEAIPAALNAKFSVKTVTETIKTNTSGYVQFPANRFVLNAMNGQYNKCIIFKNPGNLYFLSRGYHTYQNTTQVNFDANTSYSITYDYVAF